MEVVYFELNDWGCGRDYPDDEPFINWMKNDGIVPIFRDEDWVKENKLVVVESIVDMSLNYCIAATKEWVQINCPKLLTKHTQFVRYGEEDDLPEGRFGCPFLEYNEDNIGYHYAEEKEDGFGYLYYSIED